MRSIPESGQLIERPLLSPKVRSGDRPGAFSTIGLALTDQLQPRAR